MIKDLPLSVISLPQLDLPIKAEWLDQVREAMERHEALGRAFGLMEPLKVRPVRTPGSPIVRYEVVDGVSRFIILNEKKYERAPVSIEEMTDDYARLWRLDAILSTKELNVIERGKLILAREEFLTELGQRMQRGYNGNAHAGPPNCVDHIETTASLAEKVGVSATHYRAIRRVAANISPQVASVAEELGIADSVFLLSHVVKDDADPSEQQRRVEEIRSLQDSGITALTTTVRQRGGLGSSASRASSGQGKTVSIQEYLAKPVRVNRGTTLILNDRHTVRCCEGDEASPFAKESTDSALGLLVALDPQQVNLDYKWLEKRARIIIAVCAPNSIFKFIKANSHLTYQGVLQNISAGKHCLTAFIFATGTPIPVDRTIVTNNRSQFIVEVVDRYISSGQRLIVPRMTGGLEIWGGLYNLLDNKNAFLYAAHDKSRELGEILGHWKAENRRLSIRDTADTIQRSLLVQA